MSADNPRRSSGRQRSHPPTDFTNLLNGHYQHPTQPGSSPHPPPLQNRPSRRSRLAPLFTPPRQDHHYSGHEGPALAPLSLELTAAAAPQPPLPPLRSLNRGLAIPTATSLPHLFPSDSHLPLSAFSSLSPGQPQAPVVNTLPFGYRYSLRRPSGLSPGVPPFDEAPHNLEENPELSSSYSHTMSTRSGGGSGSRRDSLRSEEIGRVNKRRKVEADKASSSVYKAFRYGRYGQVEPGALKMEIASCDGGLYKDGAAHAAENILKADNSVYCTKGNRCNIVLQHQGNTPFSLKELIIKAPARNYSYPVREGMVFLSMSKDELLQNDQYHSNICPLPPASLFQQIGAFRQRAAQHLTNSGYSFEEQDENHDAEGANDIPYEMIRLALNRTSETTHTIDAQSDIETDLDNAEDPPAFYVMTECSDDEEGDAGDRDRSSGQERGSGWRSNAARWSPAPLRVRTRRRQTTFDDELVMDSDIGWGLGSSYAEDDDDDTELYDLGDATISSPESPSRDGEAYRRGPVGGERDRSRAFFIRRDSVQGSGEGASVYGPHASPSLFGNGNDAQGSSGSPGARPNAEFHIEKHKNKCTIRFNPPVTARYILLKMWNPHHDIGGNIDIQGVVAKGFAGPRFFPAKDLR